MASERLIKVVVAGDGNVGKTSLIRQYCEGRFETSRVATIGVDFQTKIVKLPDEVVKLSIWDMAGQDHFKSVREGFYRGSQAAALVFDATVLDSLKHLLKWREEVLSAVPPERLIVVANKTDLPFGQTVRYGRIFAEKIGAPFVQTSALTGAGVEEMFTQLAQLAAGKTL